MKKRTNRNPHDPVNSETLSPKQKEYVRDILRDPVKFSSHVLGLDLWPREEDILRSIANNRRTAVKACHGVGKTFTLAVAAIWWLARYREGVVLTTSPTQRQVRTQVWSEIHSLVEKASVPFPPIKSTELDLRDKHNRAIGFSTNQAENFQGYHGKQVLILADEAPGIELEIWDAVAGTMAGGKVHTVMAGNPTIPSGPFYDAFGKDRALWTGFTISAFDSPNLKGFTLEKLLATDPTEGGPLDQNPYPHLTTKRWVYDQYRAWWHGDEAGSPNWLSRVMAKFPDQAHDALFKMIWLERASQRTLTPEEVIVPTNVPLFAGVDVGAGLAETVAYVCEFRQGRIRIVGMGAWRGQDTRGHVVRFLSQFRSRLCVVNVDSIGVGHNFALHLRTERFQVQMINVALPCESKPGRGENNPAQRFVNQKACFYQALADAFEHDQVDGLTDEETIGQLAGIRCELDAHGKMKIESKEEARKRGVLSPDRAEALMLAVCKPPVKYEYIPASALGRYSESSDPWMRPNHDDDLDHRPLRGNPFEAWAPGSLARYFRRNRGSW